MFSATSAEMNVTQMTASQISGVINSHHQSEVKSTIGGETLLQQYKQCSAINDQALRDAKNIKDLVNIKVKTVPKPLYMQQRGQSLDGEPTEEINYNLRFDPLNFMQKVPCMGDRDFLVEQSILHNSTTRNRVSEAINRQKFMQQTGGTTPKDGMYWTSQEQRGRRPQQNPGLKGLLPQLPLNGLQMKKPRQSLFSHKTMRTTSHKVRGSITVNTEVDTQEQTFASPEQDEVDSSIQIDGLGSQIDPVRCLQQIFRKHERRERKPGVNHIAEKYKNMARSAKSRTNSRLVATANTFMTSGAANLQSEGFPTQQAWTNNYPHTPANAANYFSAKDRGSFPVTPGTTGAILLKHEESRVMPPATAPNGISRPEVVVRPAEYRLNSDLGAGVSSALMHQGKEQAQLVEKDNTARDSQGKKMTNSLSNATPNDSKLEETANANTQNSWRFKRKTMPISSENMAQLDKPSNIPSSNLTISNQGAGAASGQNVKSQPKSLQCSTQRVSVQSSQRQGQASGLQTLGVSPIASEDLTNAQQAIRHKLAQMKQLFEDEEHQDKGDIQSRAKQAGIPRPESSEWDLHKHKIQYEEALQKRQKHVEMEEMKQKTAGLKGEAPLGLRQAKKEDKTQVNNLDMHEDELKEFLMHRIAELRSAEETNLNDMNASQFKFRASTISNVLPSSNIDEQTRLEANYKNRFKNKGEKLHQRMLNSQQRQFRQIDSAIRKSHQRMMELAKKDIVSNRSKEACSPKSGGSQPPCPQDLQIEPTFSDESKDTVMRQRRSRRNARRQINTDLGGDMQKDRSEVGLSTQKASYNEPCIVARTPKTPQIRNYASKEENNQRNTEEQCLSEKVQTSQRVTKEIMSADGGNERPQTGNDGETSTLQQPDILDQSVPESEDLQAPEPACEMFQPPNTAVIFMIDEEEQKTIGARKVNFFTQVLRKIQKIDRDFAKEQKRRKMGIKQEAIDIVQQAMGSIRNASAVVSSEDERLPLHDYDHDEEDDVSTDNDEKEYRDAMRRLGVSDQDRIQEESEVGRQTPLESHKTGGQPDIIVLQVAGEAVEMGEDPRKSRQKSRQKSRASERGANQRNNARPSRKPSHESAHSRVNTAENVNAGEDQDYLYNHKRSSEGTQSLEPTKGGSHHKFIIMQHGNKYSTQNNMQQLRAEINQSAEPMSVQLPKTVSRQSSQSLKADSVEASPTKIGAEVGLPMATISNYKHEVESMGNIYDQKQTFSVKLSARGSINLHGSTARQGSETGGQIEVGAGSRTLTACISTQPEDISSPRSLNLTHSVVTGSQMAYFCPKRFNRFPRFTIFFKKGLQNEEGSFVSENTVSLNADFLKFLSDKRSSHPNSKNAIKVHSQKIEEHEEKSMLDVSALKDSSGRVTPSSQIMSNNQKDVNFSKVNFSATDIERAEQAASGYLSKVPLEVEQWNEYLKAKNFDPFDRVVLVKGIDNSILTSFRTLKGENNTVSDTFKIVHRKFQPSRKNNAFFKNMMSKHADKMPYQTINRVEERDEEYEYSVSYDAYHEQDTANARQGAQQHFVVDPARDMSKPCSRVDENNDTKLQHAMTAALIDIENRTASTPPAGQKVVSARGQDKKSPFRVITSLEKNKVAQVEVALKETSHAQIKRLPRPKPLSIATTSRRKQSQAGDKQSMASTFGVLGVSPLNQMTNIYPKDQEMTLMDPSNSPDWTNVKSHQDGLNSNQVRKLAQNSALPTKNFLINTQHNSTQRVMDSGAPAESELLLLASNETEKKDIKLIMQPNFQFNSMATVDRNRVDALSKQVSSNTQSGDAFAASGQTRTKSRNTDVITDAFPQLTGMSGDKSQNVTTNVNKGLSKNEMQPKSSLQLDIHKNTSPNFLSGMNQEQLMYEPRTSKLPPKIKGSQQEFISSFKTNAINDQKKAGDVGVYGSLTVKDGDQESVTDFVVTQNVLGSQFKPVQAAIMSPPLVSVIRSNTQIPNSTNSAAAADGDTTMRTFLQTQDHLLNSVQMAHDAMLDIISGSPVIHNALNGKKLKNQLKENKYGSDNQGSIQAWNSVAGSPREQRAKEGVATDRTARMVAQRPAEHVGVLKVPDSLKQQHATQMFAVEQVALTGVHKKGAVSSMIDKIYQKDRKMVNNTYKGNMLSTAVLTDMTRYHKLKSQTGVENKNYDEAWLQERIEEEMREPGLSLDFAPNSPREGGTSLHPESPLPAQRSNQTLEQRIDSTEVKRPSLPISPENLVRKSLEGTLGDLYKHAHKKSAIEAVNYSEMVNRSDHGTALARANYN